MSLGISRRANPRGSGRFSYVEPEYGSALTFIWDDAGVDQDGRITLVEEESNGLVPLHIEGHLARLKLMLEKGESIRNVIWIIDELDFQAMFSLLRFYRKYLGPLPSMEIWSSKGVRLGALEENETKRSERGPST